MLKEDPALIARLEDPARSIPELSDLFKEITGERERTHVVVNGASRKWRAMIGALSAEGKDADDATRNVAKLFVSEYRKAAAKPTDGSEG